MMFKLVIVRLEIVLWEDVMLARRLCGIRMVSGILLLLTIIKATFIYLLNYSMIPLPMVIAPNIVMAHARHSVSKGRKDRMRNCLI